MLAGAEITDEARAAAERLIERGRLTWRWRWRSSMAAKAKLLATVAVDEADQAAAGRRPSSRGLRLRSPTHDERYYQKDAPSFRRRVRRAAPAQRGDRGALSRTASRGEFA